MGHNSRSEYPRTYALRKRRRTLGTQCLRIQRRKPLSDGTHERQPLFQRPTLWRCFSKLQPYIQWFFSICYRRFQFYKNQNLSCRPMGWGLPVLTARFRKHFLSEHLYSEQLLWQYVHRGQRWQLDDPKTAELSIRHRTTWLSWRHIPWYIST